jgi:hypothetical protein
MKLIEYFIQEMLLLLSCDFAYLCPWYLFIADTNLLLES